jgi:hypothetical protein
MLVAVSAQAEEPVYPVKVSQNGRHFVDQNGKPVFWLGTTQWQLFRDYTLDEARLIVAKSKRNGFSFIQVMLVGVGDGTKTNVYGQKPWNNDNPLAPNEAYFTNVGAVLQIARENNIIISMTLYHQTNRKHIDADNAHALGKMAGAEVQGGSQHRMVLGARGETRVCSHPARTRGGSAGGRRR